MYLDFYGFREKPFNLTPDPRFLFLSKSHREAFAHLLYGINNRAGFIALCRPGLPHPVRLAFIRARPRSLEFVERSFFCAGL